MYNSNLFSLIMQDQRKRLQFLDFKALRLSSISEMGKFRGGGQK